MIFAAILGVGMTANPRKILGVAVLVVLGSAFFSCLSMSIAGALQTLPATPAEIGRARVPRRRGT